MAVFEDVPRYFSTPLWWQLFRFHPFHRHQGKFQHLSSLYHHRPYLHTCLQSRNNTRARLRKQAFPEAHITQTLLGYLACEAASYVNDLSQKGLGDLYATCVSNWNRVRIKASIFFSFICLLCSLFSPHSLFTLFLSGPSDQGVMDRQTHWCVVRTRLWCCG